MGRRRRPTRRALRHRRAAAGIAGRLTALVAHIRSGSVLATIYQRPYTQGRMAFRVLHEFLVRGSCPSYQVTLSPHLVMRGNLEFFLERQLSEVASEMSSNHRIDAPNPEG